MNEQFIVGKTSDGFTDQPVVWVTEDGQWVIKDLPVPVGTMAGIGRAINAKGEIAGSILDATHLSRAVLWTPSATGWNEAVLLGNGALGAGGINDASEIVGSVTWDAGGRRGFLWTRSRGVKDLGGLGGRYSFAAAINSRGEIAGTGLNDTRLVMWPVSARPT